MKLRAITVAFLLMLALSVPASADGGFNEYGYNYGARIFVGPADGVDKVLDGAVWGDPTYASDHLVMKWTAEWDRGNATGWSDPSGYAGAWTDNEWNGNCDGCSGEVWHYKISWDASCASGGPAPEGAYCVWGSFAVLMDQGTVPGADGPIHLWFAHATPAGYGAP